MEFKVVRKEYMVEVDIEKFSRLITREDKNTSLALFEELDELDGVTNTGYDGHFSSHVSFSIDCNEDCDKLHNKIAKIIQNHLDKK
jgi:thymidylate kinase